jgi:transposase-like protein
MSFQPSFCPCEPAQCHDRPSFQYQRKGTFTRACDGRVVQRYLCKGCGRTFSNQTFRVDHRLRRPSLDAKIFTSFISKVTQRFVARHHGCTRRTVARRLKRWGKHCQSFQARALQGPGRSLPWAGPFVFDELETFETDRRLQPVTVPMLVHRQSYFIVHTAVGTLPPRKPLSDANQARLELLEKKSGGKRISESREKVAECFAALEALAPAPKAVAIDTDEKLTYGPLLRERFGDRLVHGRTNSKAPRTYKNPLFAVNHTFAMMRDGLSRLVRRNWGHSKEREKLEWHLWIYIAWRNFVRPITNARRKESPATVAGLAPRRLEVSELLQWREFHQGSAQ